MVIIAEDSRFRSHVGIDPAEVADALGVDGAHGFWSAIRAAWWHRDRLRGASTITQQLAKNLYLSSSRSPVRKLKEAATALGLELALSKDRILELYLNVAEWGPGIWGIDAASRAYFGVPASRLSAEQAAELAATLPHPRTSNPTFRPERTLERPRSEEHTSELQSPCNLVCRLLLEKKKNNRTFQYHTAAPANQPPAIAPTTDHSSVRKLSIRTPRETIHQSAPHYVPLHFASHTALI